MRGEISDKMFVLRKRGKRKLPGILLLTNLHKLSSIHVQCLQPYVNEVIAE